MTIAAFLACGYTACRSWFMRPGTWDFIETPVHVIDVWASGIAPLPHPGSLITFECGLVYSIELIQYHVTHTDITCEGIEALR